MNIEIANRLVKLRKSNSYSQESLAEKLGVSRQAVSKWERAEASPDTDNLILLAKLYGVSLDELLKTEDEEIGEETSFGDGNTENENTEKKDSEKEDPEYVHVGLNGVHVKDRDGSEVHVGFDGIHVDNTKKNDSVHIDRNGVYVNGREYHNVWIGFSHAFPMTLIICILYLLIGACFHAWHPGWLLFLLIPIWYSIVAAIEKRNANCFAYPVFVTLLFLCAGFFLGAWHPAWVLFVTIPVYYSFVTAFHHTGRKEEKEAGDYETYDR